MITKEYLQQELRRRIDGIKPGVETTTDLTIGEMKSILVLVDALNDYEKKYNEALERARKIHDEIVNNEVIGFPGQITDIFPELRESEDERVIRTLYYLVRDHDWVNGATKGEALTWLKKQKERKPAEWSESDTLMCNAALDLLRSHPNIMASYGVNKSSIIRWLQSFRTQKRGLIDDICSKAGISIPYLDGNQWCILKGDNIQSGVVGFGDTKEDALANFIKDVPIQQKWSEEDEKIVRFYEADYNNQIGGMSMIDVIDMRLQFKNWLVNRLKSLRPQPQKLEDWTEEDERLLGDVLGCITLVQTYKACGDLKDFKMEYTGEELRSFVRSLKSRPRKQPHWKPEGQQLDCLRHMINVSTVSKIDKQLVQDLYEQLKKLM